MEKKIQKYTPYLWWPLFLLFMSIGSSEIWEFLNELPFYLRFSLPLMFTGLSFVMLINYADNKEKSMSDSFIYKPDVKATPIVKLILDEINFTQDENEFLSSKINEALVISRDKLVDDYEE